MTGGIDIHTRRVADHATVRRRQAPGRAARPAGQLRPEGSAPGVRGLADRRLLRAAAVRAARAAGRRRAVRGSPRRCCATTRSPTRASCAPTTTRTRRWRAATCCSSCASWCFRTFGGCRVGRVTDEQRDGRRPARAGLGLALPDARGPHRAGRDVLGGLEVARHGRRRVPRPLLLADGRAPGTRSRVAGVWLFGQRERRRYLTSACRRMRQLTAQALRGEHPAGGEARTATPSARPRSEAAAWS